MFRDGPDQGHLTHHPQRVSTGAHVHPVVKLLGKGTSLHEPAPSEARRIFNEGKSKTSEPNELGGLA